MHAACGAQHTLVAWKRAAAVFARSYALAGAFSVFLSALQALIAAGRQRRIKPVSALDFVCLYVYVCLNASPLYNSTTQPYS